MKRISRGIFLINQRAKEEILGRLEPFYHRGNQAGKLGVYFAFAALDALGIDKPKQRQIIIETETPFTFSCTLKEAFLLTLEDFRIKEYGKRALTVIDKATGRGVRICEKETLRNELTRLFNSMRELYNSGKPDEASGLVRTYMDNLIKRPYQELVGIKEVKVEEGFFKKPLPTNYREVICSGCGESVLELYARLEDGKTYCKPCYRSRMPRCDEEYREKFL